MSIKIIKSCEIVKATNIIVTIFGLPGLGKTTLGLTSKNPLLLDIDGGILRAGKKSDSIRVIAWSDVESIDKKDVQDYSTLVIDTTGRLCEILAEDIITKNPRMANGNNLGLKGFGELSAIFKRFINKIKGFGVDVVLIAHAVEKDENETTHLRIDTMGSSKMEIYKCSDLIGNISMINNKRTLNFSPTDRAIGKNCANLPVLHIPDIKENGNFLAEIIQKAKDNLNALSDEQILAQKVYDERIVLIKKAYADKDIGLFNSFLANDEIKGNPGLKSLFHNYATELGYVYIAESKSYIDSTDPEEIKKNEVKAKQKAEKAAKSSDNQETAVA